MISCEKCGNEYDSQFQAGCPICQLKMGLHKSNATQIKPAPAFDAAELSEKFEHLEVLELVGTGGMGAVYTARQKKLDRIVALKVVRPDISDAVEFARRFEREAKALARLNHPNIISIFDFGNIEGIYYYLMEYVDGTNLAELANSESLSPAESLEIVSQVCKAIQYAHENGVVHRDIKPTNILLNADGLVKIADFGLAKLCAPDDQSAHLTQTRQVFGTPSYMAPEQIEASKEVDHRADIYSLGVVFYELLTGELPLGRFDPPSQKIKVDVRLDEVVLRALEKHPERRYQAARELYSDISQFSQNVPVPPTKIRNQFTAPPLHEGPLYEGPRFAPWYVPFLIVPSVGILGLSIMGIVAAVSGGGDGFSHIPRRYMMALFLGFWGGIFGLVFFAFGQVLWRRARPEHFRYTKMESPVRKLLSYRALVYFAFAGLFVSAGLPWIYVGKGLAAPTLLGIDLWFGRTAVAFAAFLLMMLVFIDIYEGTRRYFCIVTMVTAFLMFAVCTPMSTVPLNALEMVADPHIVPSSRLSAPARIGPGFTVGSAFNMMLAVLGIVGTIVNVIQKLEYQVGKYPTNVLSK